MVVIIYDSIKGERKVLGIPIKLSFNPGSIRTHPPNFGQDTFRILTEFGYKKSSIYQFRKENII